MLCININCRNAQSMPLYGRTQYLYGDLKTSKTSKTRSRLRREEVYGALNTMRAMFSRLFAITLSLFCMHHLFYAVWSPLAKIRGGLYTYDHTY